MSALVTLRSGTNSQFCPVIEIKLSIDVAEDTLCFRTPSSPWRPMRPHFPGLPSFDTLFVQRPTKWGVRRQKRPNLSLFFSICSLQWPIRSDFGIHSIDWNRPPSSRDSKNENEFAKFALDANLNSIYLVCLYQATKELLLQQGKLVTY